MTAIACGYSHVLALSAEDELYSWGRGEVGILGQIDYRCDFEADRLIVERSVGYWIYRNSKCPEEAETSERYDQPLFTALFHGRLSGGV